MNILQLLFALVTKNAKRRRAQYFPVQGIDDNC